MGCYVLRDSKEFLSFDWPFDFFPSFMPAAFHSGKKSKGRPQDKNALLSLGHNNAHSLGRYQDEKKIAVAKLPHPYILTLGK